MRRVIVSLGVVAWMGIVAMVPMNIWEAVTFLDYQGNVVTLESWSGYYVVMELWKPELLDAERNDRMLFERIYHKTHQYRFPFSQGIKYVRCALTPNFDQWQASIQKVPMEFAVEVVDTAAENSQLLRQLDIREFPYYVVYNHVGEVIYHGNSPLRLVRILRRAARGR